MNKEVKWLQNMREDRLDSVWYGGDMVTIVLDNRYYITITAAGDIRAKIKGDFYCDKNNGGCFEEYLTENGIENDQQLQEAIEKDEVLFGDNNWFEIVAWDDQEKDYFGLYSDNVCDLDPNDNFDWVEDWVNKNKD